MKKLTYKEAYDKIIEAYFKDEIKPYDPHFCFCGTLCNNSVNWQINSYDAIFQNRSHNDFGNYSGRDYTRMERALIGDGTLAWMSGKMYEDGLFINMCAALEVLKQIHKERGEDVDGVQEFKKRELVK